MKTVNDIRKLFLSKKNSGEIEENGTIEILNASFIADESSIFGVVNKDYIEKEKKWYLSTKLNINAMEKPIPSIWKNISGCNGEVNSNYGWCVFSHENNNQYLNALIALKLDKNTRQAALIYNRPSMHNDASRCGCNDFMCTYSTQLIIRNNKLHYFVFMRSNDAVFGYKNDKAWHDYIHKKFLYDLLEVYPSLEIGRMHWNAASLHIYPRHFELIK